MFPERFPSAHHQAVAARSKMVAVASVLVLVGTLAQPAAASPSKAPAAAGDNSHWMADNAAAIGQRYLQQLIIPGAHDAGTYAGTNQPIAQAQDNSFLQQLTFGTRYFDLRAKYVSGRQIENLADDYYFYHGPVNSSVKLTALLDQVAEFYASPANQKEITILDFSGATSEVGDVTTDGDPNDRIGQICASFQQKLGPYLIDQSVLPKDTDIGHMTVNQVWALPGTPRIITNLGQCAAAGYWPLNATLGGYYANQCYVEPYTLYNGIYASLASGLSGRKSPLNFFALSVASTPTSDCFFALYYLNIQQRQEILALDKVKSWFDNNVNNARRDLNIIYGDYVTNTSLVDYAIAMNQAGPTLTINGSAAVPAQPLSPGQQVSLSCKRDAQQPVSKLEVSGQPTVSTSNPNDTLVAQLKSLTDNAAHALVATCTDASGRVARVVLPIAHAPTATPAWIIDRTQRILYFDAASSTWTAVDGAGTRIAVARDGQPWVVNELGQVWRRNAGSAGYRDGAWVRVAEAGTASDIAIGWDGSVWALAQPEFDNGTHTILYFDAASQTFTRRDASGARLAVAPDGQPWAISAEGKVVRAARSGIDWSIPTPPSGFLRNYLTTTWENVPSPNGRLGSLTVGPLGTAWSIASDHSGPIFQYDGVARSWKQLGDAAGTDLAADADGVWATNQDGQVWRYALATGAWALVTNDIGATDIAVSAARLGQ